MIKKKINKHNDHCCEKMAFFLDENRVGIGYHPVSRGYYIFLHDYEYAKHCIFYCPWCGTKLPPALNDTYFKVLADEYQIYDLDEEEAKRIPKEFYSDKWWKKRGL